jgi:6-phosphogluconolactonase (cycloisomerase 2 family)
MRYLLPILKSASTIFLLAFGVCAWAAPTITVASPRAGTVGTPTFFDATASTASCPAGISAVRIYTAPGVAAFTTNSPHVETFLNLKPGTYNTVIQAWDNCGGVSKLPITISVTGTAGVHVFLPSTTSSTTPVHVAVSAENSACAGGISAVRIYPSSGVNAFTSSGATLDAFLDLMPGTYSAIAQAWDNCGHVFKTPFTITSTGGAFGKFLYLADYDLNNIAEFQLASGAVVNPNGSGAAPQYGVPNKPNSVAVDPPGNIAYAGLIDGRVSIFDINRANGSLQSKGTIAAPGAGPATVTVDRSGNFLFVAEEGSNSVTSYRVNRSSGALTLIGTVSTANGPNAIITDWTGHFVYTANFKSDDISGFAINTQAGNLTAVPGSPFLVGPQPIAIGATSHVVYTLNSGNGTASGFTINASNGSLAAAPGSPYLQSECCGYPNMLDLDPIHNLLFHSAIGFTFGTDNIIDEQIQSNGSISGGNVLTGVVYNPAAIALDPSYQFLYTTQVNGYTGTPELVSFKYASNGTGSIYSGPIARPAANAIQIAVSR